MYKRFLYIALLILNIHSAISQDLSIKFGEKISYNKKYSSVAFFEQDGKKLLFNKKPSKSCDFIVHVFNSYLKTESSREFNLEGHAYIDIIDFQYPNMFYNYWHTQYDTPENCSPQSLGQVGTLLVNYIYGPTHK